MTMCLSGTLCYACKHLRTDYSQKREAAVTCDAYPEGIPNALLWEGVPHDKPYPGDHGIQFEPYKEE